MTNNLNFYNGKIAKAFEQWLHEQGNDTAISYWHKGLPACYDACVKWWDCTLPAWFREQV